MEPVSSPPIASQNSDDDGTSFASFAARSPRYVKIGLNLFVFPHKRHLMDPSLAERPGGLAELDVKFPVWDQFFMVAPLVVIGTREENGDYDLAPKHMVTPLGWDNYFGFVCTPEHATYQNIVRSEVFTVSFPNADAVVATSLAASPRCSDDSKPSLVALPRFAATVIDGEFLCESTLFFECELDRIVDGFGTNSLIAGKIVSAHVAPDALRSADVDDQDLLDQSPLLAYLAPARYSSISRSHAFPFPAGFRKSKEQTP